MYPPAMGETVTYVWSEVGGGSGSILDGILRVRGCEQNIGEPGAFGCVRCCEKTKGKSEQDLEVRDVQSEYGTGLRRRVGSSSGKLCAQSRKVCRS